MTGLSSLPNDSLFFPEGPSPRVDGQNTGKRIETTIDRAKPVTSPTRCSSKSLMRRATDRRLEEHHGDRSADGWVPACGTGRVFGRHTGWLTDPGGGTGSAPSEGGTGACGAATKKLAKAKTKLAILSEGSPPRKIKQARVSVKRAKAAKKVACGA